MLSKLRAIYSIYVRRQPVFLHHKVTIRCNCSCRSCTNWSVAEDPAQLLMRTEVEQFLSKAARAGFYSYWAWGGEPMLREDAPALMAHAKGQGLYTSIATNGSLLRERGAEFIPHTDYFMVSLDGVGKTEDSIRRFPGLFDRVVGGVEFLKKHAARVRLVFTVNRLNLGEIEEAAGLARELGVCISYSTMTRLPGHNDELVIGRDEEREAYSKVDELRRRGFPVGNTPKFIRTVKSGRLYHCRFPAYSIWVEWNGRIYSCELGPGNLRGNWGDARTVALPALFKSREFREKTREFGACNACRQPCCEMGCGHLLLQSPIRWWISHRFE